MMRIYKIFHYLQEENSIKTVIAWSPSFSFDYLDAGKMIGKRQWLMHCR